METPAAAALPARLWRRGEPADRLCLAGIGLHLSLKLLALLATAWLLTRPLVHLAMVGAMSSMVGGGAFARVGDLALWQVVLAALVGVMAFDVFYWWAGNRWGRLIPTLLRRTARIEPERVKSATNLMRRHGFWVLSVRYFLPLPNALLQVLAGASDMSVKVYMSASALGALLITGVLVSLGWVVGESGVELIETIGRNAVRATIVLVALLLLTRWLRSRRTPTDPAAAPAPADSALATPAPAPAVP